MEPAPGQGRRVAGPPRLQAPGPRPRPPPAAVPRRVGGRGRPLLSGGPRGGGWLQWRPRALCERRVPRLPRGLAAWLLRGDRSAVGPETWVEEAGLSRGVGCAQRGRRPGWRRPGPSGGVGCGAGDLGCRRPGSRRPGRSRGVGCGAAEQATWAAGDLGQGGWAPVQGWAVRSGPATWATSDLGRGDQARAEGWAAVQPGRRSGQQAIWAAGDLGQGGLAEWPLPPRPMLTACAASGWRGATVAGGLQHRTRSPGPRPSLSAPRAPMLFLPGNPRSWGCRGHRRERAAPASAACKQPS